MSATALHNPNYSAPYGGPTPDQLAPTQKQMAFARKIALSGGIALPWEVQQSRSALSRWIDSNRDLLNTNPYSHLPSSKQVGFAERLARLKRRAVPEECFRDRKLMSRWIDANK